MLYGVPGVHFVGLRVVFAGVSVAFVVWLGFLVDLLRGCYCCGWCLFVWLCFRVNVYFVDLAAWVFFLLLSFFRCFIFR